MTCGDLERWLDEGAPPERHLEAMAHARICARCSAMLAVADELETALSGPVPHAPAGFTARVMARVAATPQVRARIPVMEILPFFQPVPWWVRVALEPASLLAILLASILVWRGDALFTLASTGAVQLAAWLARTLPPAAASPSALPDAGPVAGLWVQPLVLTSLALALAPLAWMGSRVLFRWSEHLAGPRQGRLAGR